MREVEISNEAFLAIEDELPGWVVEEVTHPLDMGEGRNNQMIRVGPSLLRAGFPEDELTELFVEMYPDVNESQVAEIEAVVRNAVKLSETDGAMTKSDFKMKADYCASMTKRWKAYLPDILSQHEWTLAEIEEDGNQLGRLPLREQRTIFLSHLFDQEAVIWTGEVWQTGLRKSKAKKIIGDWRSRFRHVREIIGDKVLNGEFTSHCTFIPGTYSRCNEAVVTRGYLVIESDILSMDQVGAVFKFLGTHGLTLRAIVSTGGKSLHGWFDWPGDEGLDAIAAQLTGLDCDPSTLKASQPVRLPGIVRRDSGRPQRLLWLEPPTTLIS